MKYLFLKGVPTRAQSEAGNYRMTHRMFRGLDLSIENPKGSIRSGVDRGGHRWSVTMAHDYGYIKRTLGIDGDHFDCIVGPDDSAPSVFLITTMAPPDFDKIDEQKAMLGFAGEKEAKAAFAAMYDNPKFFGSMKAMPFASFKERVMQTRRSPGLIKAIWVIAPNPT